MFGATTELGQRPEGGKREDGRVWTDVLACECERASLLLYPFLLESVLGGEEIPGLLGVSSLGRCVGCVALALCSCSCFFLWSRWTFLHPVFRGGPGAQAIKSSQPDRYNGRSLGLGDGQMHL